MAEPGDLQVASLDYATTRPAPGPGPGGLRWRTVGLILGLAALLVLGVLGWRILDGILGSNAPIQKTQVWVTGIKSQAKYVVASQTLTVKLEQAESYTAWWMYFGTTVAQIRVDDCKVQYVIPTDQIKATDFTYDGKAKTLKVSLPRPVLDQEFLDVPTDPEKWWVYSASAWARFNKDEVEYAARRALRPELLKFAKAKGFDEATEAVAVLRLKRVLAEVMQIPDLHVEVEFRQR